MGRWTRDQLIVAYGLYCQMPFGKIHSKNSIIINVAKKIDRTPSALAMKMLNFSSLDPAIVESGRSGLGNASVLDREIWSEFHKNWEQAVTNAQMILEQDEPQASETDEVDYFSDDTERMVLARRNQSFFRSSVLASYRSRCCISGLSHPKLLVASHIVPWRSNKQNRLNPKNGLCLSALHDRAFDLGLISVSPAYKIQVSKNLKKLPFRRVWAQCTVGD